MQGNVAATDQEPSSWLERISKLLLREPQDRAQLIDMLRDAKERELLDTDKLSMIEGILQIADMQARDIMIPRPQMITVDVDAKPEEFLPTVIESGHSRFPIVGEHRDKIIGILLAKDLLKYSFHHGDNKFNIYDVVRPTIFVPESKRLDALLKEFRNTHIHMAIVLDEYASIAGLVTIEDVLEQIVGEIEDEFDTVEELAIKQHSPTQFTVKAHASIEEFNEFFHADFKDEEFDTIGGIVMQAFGHLPRRGEKIKMGSFEFKVLHADNRRIRLMRVTVRK